MKFLIPTCVFVTLMSPAAQAVEFTGGNLSVNDYSLDYFDDYDVNFNQTDAKGTLAFGFGNGFGGQVGLSSGSYDGDFSYLNGEVHVTDKMSSDVTLGALIGAESYDFDDPNRAKFGFAGFEMNYAKNAFAAQTALIFNKNLNYIGFFYRAYVMDATLGLSDKVSLRGGLHVARSQYDGEDKATFQYAYLGAGYAITPQITLDLDYGRVNRVNVYSQQSIGLNLTYHFNGATVFDQRASNSIIPGW